MDQPKGNGYKVGQTFSQCTSFLFPMHNLSYPVNQLCTWDKLLFRHSVTLFALTSACTNHVYSMMFSTFWTPVRHERKCNLHTSLPAYSPALSPLSTWRTSFITNFTWPTPAIHGAVYTSYSTYQSICFHYSMNTCFWWTELEITKLMCNMINIAKKLRLQSLFVFLFHFVLHVATGDCIDISKYNFLYRNIIKDTLAWLAYSLWRMLWLNCVLCGYALAHILISHGVTHIRKCRNALACTYILHPKD